jgi:CheY-like chemotaxis protein
MKRRWILLGEDDARDAALTKRALGSFSKSYDVVVALDGVEVLDQLYRSGNFEESAQGNPAVVLLDLKMPKVDGFEVLRRVKSDPALMSIPIVMLTSSRHDPDVSRCYLLGANGYIVKPMDFARYTRALQDFGRFWLEVNETPPETKDYAHATSENE